METIQLPDGRILAYAEYGDPGGKPVFLFHGVPGSRIFRPPLDGLTARKKARLITVDRPGYGGSTFQPGRRITDWPEDILRLADYLHLDRFAVCGHSGGGPYVLACARFIPERLTAAGVISSLGPVDAPGALDGIIAQNRLAFTVGGKLPWPLFRLAMGFVFRRGKNHPEALVHPDYEDPSNPDNAMLAMPGGWQVCLDSTREAFRQGIIGHAWEGYLDVRPWGFSLEEISTTVDLWHGLCDVNAPVGMGRAIARAVPHCRARFLEGEGHLLLFKYWGEILDTLS
ncbi:MAG: alpha/beta hydrolase [Anaerolineales bacterium]|nr:alpha/beta hydrolase [Anaerolineales bacterium]